MKWATRANIHIDRAASAGLIRCHIDPTLLNSYFSTTPPNPFRRHRIRHARSRTIPPQR